VDEAILAAALDLLAAHGYARLTMDQVAERAGVGKASLYLRWPNKVGLVAAAIQHRSDVLPEAPDTGRLYEDVRQFLRRLVRAYGSGAEALEAVSGEIKSNPELAQAWRRSLTTRLSESLRGIVDRAVQRGELPPQTDVELLSGMPLMLLRDWRLEYGSRPDEASVERIVNQFFAPR
jgi:AcrR family transcriptional regulator